MNPPYKSSLHLEIVDQMLKSFPEAEIVNLSPIRWLQDPIAERKKNSDWNTFENIRNGLEDLHIIPAVDANKLFGIEQTSDLGIYVISDKGGLSLTSKNSIIEKVLDKVQGVPIKKVKNTEANSYFVLVNIVANAHRERINAESRELTFLKNQNTYGKYYHNRVSDNGRTLFENKANNKHSTNGDVENFACVEFGTEQEAINFVDYLSTNLFKFILNLEVMGRTIYPQYLPFMPDYTRPWTDQELYEYFGLTEEEIKIVEETF